MNEVLYSIMEKYYEDFLRKKNLISEVVKNSFPIVWFGNMEKFFNSKIKVLTIGQNPSDDEFPTDNPETRFPGVQKAFEQGEFEIVRDSLNGYFDYKRNPYWKWFIAYERVLGLLNFGATYGGIESRNPNAENIAIHIDFISAIPTNPTYGGLKNHPKKLLKCIDLFNELFEYLTKSHKDNSLTIVLFSTSKKDICDHFELSKQNQIYEFKIGLESKVEAYKKDNKYFIWGEPYVKPFRKVRDIYIDKPISEICKIISTDGTLQNKG